MSLWGMRFFHTAKMPGPVRQRAARNGYKQLDFLVALRDHAIMYASSETICIYASFVHLPPATPDEAESLRNISSDEATTEHESDQEQEDSDDDPWDAQAAASATAVDEPNTVDSQGDTGSEEHAGDDTLPDAEAAVDDTYDHDMKVLAPALPSAPAQAQGSATNTTTAESSVNANNYLTNDPGSSERDRGQSLGQLKDIDPPSSLNTEGVNADENPMGNSPKWLTNTPGSPYENKAATSFNNANSPSQADKGYATAAQEGGDADADADSVGEAGDTSLQPNNIRVPLYRRPSTLFDTPPTWAEEYKKFLDKAFEAWRLFYNTRAPRPLRTRLADRRTHEAAVKRYNLINLGLYPCVTVEHLLELKLRIDDVARFCDFMTANMMEIEYAKDLRKEVIYTYPANSPLRLRTKGLRSSLRFVTHVDEGWDDEEDNWGMPPLTKKRGLMQFHASQNLSWYW
ncbi:uncharacterized protein FSUBG_10901 [Fusarium subglutinans]|uniref:Uncharacterized protein n=1 Tax=Gibberella subglutinans TaxID=42677 RepID=A0A8H5LGC9_GIBSU|nr:uncharacterized protein FSUBG_10901 [Fusarium subglutinans]KAF5590285.1 hypothetical protein FSUBG_10901 [Fusarium subglutinans]